MPSKRALLVGCNYPGTSSALKGCVNDCKTMSALLVKHFGFQPSDIAMMLDTDPNTLQPTGANIKTKLRELVAASKPGDVLFFHYSGHGTQVPDDKDESDGLDEAIVPCDMNMLCDDDLRAIFCNLDPKVKFTMVADCCHSGSLLDHNQVAISGPKPGEAIPANLDLSSLLAGFISAAAGGKEVGSDGAQEGSGREMRNRALPTNKFLELLSEKLGSPVVKGNIRSSMVKMYGKDASAKAINYVQLAQQGMAAFSEAQRGNYSGCIPFLKNLIAACSGQPPASGGAAAAPAATPGKPPSAGGAGAGAGAGGQQVASAGGAAGEPQFNLTHTPEPASGAVPAKLGKDIGILVTGCQDNETSADACPSGNPAEAFGALTNGINTIVTAHFQQHPNSTISSRTLVAGVRDALAQARFSQNPCLECSETNADGPFIVL